MEQTLQQLPESINLLNGVLAFLGMVLFFLIRYSRRKNKKQPFLMGFWLKDNFLEFLINLITSMALFLMMDTVVYFLQTFISEQIPLENIAAFLIGYSGQWVFKLIFGRFKNN